MLHVVPERPGDGPAIDQLLDRVFGTDRYQKASYRFREKVAPIADLSWVALEDDQLIGTIRYWPIVIGTTNHPALLLGPLGILPEKAGQGIGRALVYRSIERAIELQHDLVLLVGDHSYYQRFGFQPATPLGFLMPGEKRPERLQVMELRDGIFDHVQGSIKKVSLHA